MAETTYRILLLGDFHFGESYRRAGARVLAEKGYEHSLEHLMPFAEKADYFIVNLESPIVNPEAHPSPLKGVKTYIHWADPEHTPRALKKLGVDAVSLANNHTVDHGVEGLLSSFEHLSAADIPWFGAGKNIEEATRPHIVALPEAVGGGEIHFHGSFQYSKAHDETFGFYAKETAPGCAPLSRAALENRSVRHGAEKAFHIAFPHWGANYKWRGASQRRLGDMLFDQGCDLVLGHGSHCLQQLERRKQRWVVYSIGNGNFQSGGRFQRYIEENGILPMGAWAMLHVEMKSTGERSTHLRLYPVYSDNNETGFQPGPVSEEDFYQVLDRIRGQTAVQSRFDNEDRDFGRDELGWHIRVELGEWMVNEKPANLGAHSGQGIEGGGRNKKVVEETSLGVYPDQDSLYIRQQQTETGKNVAPLLISQAAEKEGATTEWIDSRIAVIHYGDRRVLLQGHRGGESAVGKALIGDKYLSKRLLLEAGVSTPRGDLARTPEEALAKQKEYCAPVVVKPRFGLKGRGVSVNLTSREEITEAFRRADSVKGGVVVEEYIEGADEFRCLTTPDECVSVVRRILPNVTGDGSSTIRELIDLKNEQRKYNPSTFGRPITTDEVTEAYLKRNGLSYDYVPSAGQNLTVRDVGGLSSGGEPYEYSRLVSDEVKDTAAHAARAIPGLSWGGADIILSRETGKPYVIEINSDADISGAAFPFYGKPANVAGHIWSMRLQMANPEVTSAPVHPEINGHNSTLLREFCRDLWNNNEVRFEKLFLTKFSEWGYKIHRESPTISRLVDSSGREHWLRGAVSTSDLAVVTEAVRRHRVVRRLLRNANVPRTRSARVRRSVRALRFIRNNEEEIVVLPQRDEWGSSLMKSFTDVAAVVNHLSSTSQSWIVQTRPRGEEMLVLASPDGGLCVLGEEVAEPSGIMEAVDVATKAVRAVPGLRWAFVSVIVRNNGSALVEGMSLNPKLKGDWRVIAGSLEGAFGALIE